MFYQKRGKLPKKKHITFYKEGTKELYREELVSSLGFSGIYCTKYRLHASPQVLKIREITHTPSQIWKNALYQPYHFETFKIPSKGDILTSRRNLMSNKDITISIAHVSENNDKFYRNGFCHELIFIHHGEGKVETEYGTLKLKKWDYLILPKGCTAKFNFDNLANTKLFIIESPTPFEIPKHYRNDYGQLLEHAPYCERDFHTPIDLIAKDMKGEFILNLKLNERVMEYTLDHHPFDVVGWDGHHYPYTFNIQDFNPVVGKIHLPPPVHLVFTTGRFVVCNFVPRLFDFHPEAIPAPYYHHNFDSDEVLYYVDGDFMSRKGVGPGSITYHPMGVSHGPQPGKTEASVGKKETFEYAVMVDTFSPLELTHEIEKIYDKNYPFSWLP